MIDTSKLTFQQPFRAPDALTVVTGRLRLADVAAIKAANIEHVINFLPEHELEFDERAACEAAGIAYTHIPLASVDDLKQLSIMAFDKALRLHHGKKTLMHCADGEFVGAAVALRAGWLRGRKMDTCLEHGAAHGLDTLTQEVSNRLLVPR